MAEGICSDSIYGTGMKHYLKYIQAALSQYVGHTDSKTGISHTPLGSVLTFFTLFIIKCK
jgi:hypothetical protein